MKSVLIHRSDAPDVTFSELKPGDVFDWGSEKPGLPVALRLNGLRWTYLPDGDPDNSACLNPGEIKDSNPGEIVTRVEDAVLTVTI